MIEPIGDYFICGIDETKQKVGLGILPFNFESHTYKSKICIKSLLDAFKGIQKKSEI